MTSSQWIAIIVLLAPVAGFAFGDRVYRRNHPREMTAAEVRYWQATDRLWAAWARLEDLAVGRKHPVHDINLHNLDRGDRDAYKTERGINERLH